MGLLADVLALDHETVRAPEAVVYGRPHRIFDLDGLPGGYDRLLLMERPPLDDVPDAVLRPLLHAAFATLPRTRVARRIVRTLALGADPVDVATERFDD